MIIHKEVLVCETYGGKGDKKSIKVVWAWTKKAARVIDEESRPHVFYSCENG